MISIDQKIYDKDDTQIFICQFDEKKWKYRIVMNLAMFGIITFHEDKFSKTFNLSRAAALNYLERLLKIKEEYGSIMSLKI